MITLIVVIIVIITSLFIFLYERFKQEILVAEIVDNEKIVRKVVSKETELVIAQLKDAEKLKLRRYNNLIVLPDGQEISYRYDNLNTFKTTSKLNYEPTSTEYKILAGIIKKLYPTL